MHEHARTNECSKLRSLMRSRWLIHTAIASLSARAREGPEVSCLKLLALGPVHRVQCEAQACPDMTWQDVACIKGAVLELLIHS